LVRGIAAMGRCFSMGWAGQEGQGSVAIEKSARASQEKRQEALTATSTRVMMGMVALAVSLSLLEERNDWRVTIVFYLPIALFLLVAEVLLRARKPRATGWLISSLFWLVVASATWFFGGLHFEMGSAYIVSVMLAAATLGSRAAVGFGMASALAASFVSWADFRGVLPVSLAPASPINAWISLTISLVIASLLLRATIMGSQEAWLEAARAAQERAEAEAKYLLAQKLEPIGRLASGVAHDFNNILSVISNVAFLLRDAKPEEVPELVSELQAASRRGELMTRQLLSFNRKRDFEVRAIDVCELLRSVSTVLARLVGDDVKVHCETCPGAVWVRADQGQLEQVLLNLAVNAREAMPQGGTLTITCDRVDGGSESVALLVSDTGSGMDEETSSRALEPLFTTKETGTGLGLSTVSDVVKRLGGSLRFTSSVGEGTSFEIVLPQTAADARAEPIPEKPVIDRKAPLRVLLAEDEPHVRRASIRLIESMGHEVVAVTNGAEALSLILNGARFDVVVSDVQMPVMTGIEFARKLEEISPGPPVILVTGHLGELPNEVKGTTTVHAFLTKPFSHEELEEAIAVAGALGSSASPT
jgi:signal transduction histidine kinase/ActR/RegA family two-component response regulator